MKGSPRGGEHEVDQALARLRAEMQSLSAPPGIEAAVLREFRARKPGRRTSRWIWSLAAAAAVVALAIFAARPSRPLPAPPSVALRHAPPAPAIGIAGSAAPRPAAAASSRPRQPDVATDFFPVRYGVPLDGREFVEIVRVTVPRAVMVRYGLPAAGDLAAPVSADIIVGRDRVAQAIRFVH